MSRYMRERLIMKLQSKKTNSEVKAEKAVKGTWFDKKIAQARIKRTCENCGKALAPSMVINPTAVVAHILPKRKDGGCPSVAFHENNYMFLCESCHTTWDEASSEEMEQMKVYLVAYHRVQTFLSLIPAAEFRHVPKCFTKSLPDLLL